jgi:general secretion pathway protein D
MVELNARKSTELSTLQRETRIEEPTKVKQEVLEKLERPTNSNRLIQPNAEVPTPAQP